MYSEPSIPNASPNASPNTSTSDKSPFKFPNLDTLSENFDEFANTVDEVREGLYNVHQNLDSMEQAIAQTIGHLQTLHDRVISMRNLANDMLACKISYPVIAGSQYKGNV